MFSFLSLAKCLSMAGHKSAPAKLQHSVKVPQFYKTAANIAKRVTEERCSLKELVFNANKHLVSNAGDGFRSREFQSNVFMEST